NEFICKRHAQLVTLVLTEVAENCNTLCKCDSNCSLTNLGRIKMMLQFWGMILLHTRQMARYHKASKQLKQVEMSMLTKYDAMVEVELERYGIWNRADYESMIHDATFGEIMKEYDSD